MPIRELRMLNVERTMLTGELRMLQALSLGCWTESSGCCKLWAQDADWRAQEADWWVQDTDWGARDAESSELRMLNVELRMLLVSIHWIVSTLPQQCWRVMTMRREIPPQDNNRDRDFRSYSDIHSALIHHCVYGALKDVLRGWLFVFDEVVKGAVPFWLTAQAKPLFFLGEYRIWRNYVTIEGILW